MLKIGDMVICIGNDVSSAPTDSDPDYPGDGWKKGKQFVIHEIIPASNNPKGRVLWPNGGCGVWEKFVELVKPKSESLQEIVDSLVKELT